MRQTSSVLYIAVDELIPLRGRSLQGLDEFTAALDHEAIPAVWLTSRSRLQFDDARRKHAHTHPFIAEDGCAVYLPEDYFHLRPASDSPRTRKAATLRLGRFTCIPVADGLPAAAEALQTLSQDTGVPVVTLRSLSPRELMQNTGLPQKEAELARQRDFDDIFFFAGASDEEVGRFLTEGRNRDLQFRQHGVLWSAAIGPSVQRCISPLPIWLPDSSLSASAPYFLSTASPTRPPRISLIRLKRGVCHSMNQKFGSACSRPSQREPNRLGKNVAHMPVELDTTIRFKERVATAGSTNHPFSVG